MTLLFYSKKHKLTDSSRDKIYSFDDKYKSLDEYLSLIKEALIECKRVLRDDGSLLLHCDKTASHHLRFVLDEILAKITLLMKLFGLTRDGQILKADFKTLIK
ncbi:DNA methyltransferase [Bacteroides sp. CR5/BHMF/2]|nr:DNA methyltransferase [Bacteroides sp. CR5/BHMF/2]